MDIKKKLTTAVVDAQYRVAAEQAARAARAGIVAGIAGQNSSSDVVKNVEKFLDSELGLAVVKFTAGLALNAIPGISETPQGARISEELTTGGIADVGNTVIGQITSNIGASIMNSLSNLPEPSRVTATAPEVTETESKTASKKAAK